MIVDIKGVGQAQFPDDMAIADIRSFLRNKYYDRAAQGQSDILSPQPQTASPYEPTLTERLGGGIAEGLKGAGLISDNYGAQQIGKNVTALGEFLPGIGDASAGDEFGRALSQGNYGDAAIAGVGTIPVLGDMAIFAGALAKNADLGALKKAQALELQGKGRDEIWSETGWFNDRGDWKFEVDDSASKANPYQVEPAKAYSMLYDDAIIAGDGSLNKKLKSIRPYKDYSAEKLIKERNMKWGDAEARFDAGDENALSVFMDDVKGIDSMLDAMRANYAPMKGYLKHSELYSQYPDAASIHTRVDGEIGSLGAYIEGVDSKYGGQAEQIQLKDRPDFDKPKSTALHELQHAIQQREGFQRGGNPEEFGRSIDERVAEFAEMFEPRLKELEAIPESNLTGAERLELVNAQIARDNLKAEVIATKGGMINTPHDKYKRLAGEAEARLVQTRMNMTPEQRRARPPWEDLDVPEDELIYRK